MSIAGVSIVCTRCPFFPPIPLLHRISNPPCVPLSHGSQYTINSPGNKINTTTRLRLATVGFADATDYALNQYGEAESSFGGEFDVETVANYVGKLAATGTWPAVMFSWKGNLDNPQTLVLRQSGPLPDRQVLRQWQN